MSERRFAIVFGYGRVAEYVRQQFPPELPCVDIRISRSATADTFNGRELCIADGPDVPRILSLLRENRVTDVLFCGRFLSPGSILVLGNLYFNLRRKHGRLHGVAGLTVAELFSLIDEELKALGISVRSILSFDCGSPVRVDPGYNGANTSDLDLEAVAGRHYLEVRSPPFFRPVQSFLATATKVYKQEGYVGGTDRLITKFRRPARIGDQAVFLFKLPMMHCNPAYDPPVIGADTIRMLVDKGIKGVVVDPESTIFMQREECLRLCNQRGIFIYGLRQRLAEPPLGRISPPG